ncbi:hypothetical protein C2E20_8520 [Micractinium conductrix]|uniref:Sec-independent translocase chloroplastic n=1 Tax=Micractinium conductrix TaxID=554055 RepID=A0A2P6V173_9CHLO|nr:hypothetical protein C2E20_8520 [Micractinium conductrix]|eukprot:PSC67842.1 hypothetical protein C2E20_8520 [Micractinium conductrix]
MALTLLQQRLASPAAATCSGRGPALAPRTALGRKSLSAGSQPARRPVTVRAEDDEGWRSIIQPPPEGEVSSTVQQWLNPPKEDLPEDFEMPIWDHLDELRERVLVGALAAGTSVLACFLFSKELVVFLEAPVAAQGVRFLQLSPGEFFFTTLKVGGYAGVLLAVPTILYEIAAYVVPGLTKSERQFLAPVILGSSVLFYAGLLFSYEILTPAALSFFVNYADGAVESLWSIDQYFEFVLVLMLSTGLSFQVPVIQVMLGQLGLVTSEMMFSQWRYVVVGATVAAAVLTPSTDPFTQTLLAVPLVGLYMGGASAVRWIESTRQGQNA